MTPRSRKRAIAGRKLARNGLWSPSAGLYAYAPPGNLWPSAPRGWPLYHFDNHTLQSDGSLPPTPPTTWDGATLHASAPLDRPEADLALEITGLCLSGCDEASVAEVGIQLRNQGPADATLPTTVQLVALTDAGELPLAEHTFTTPVPSGQALEGVVLTVPALDAAGRELRLRVVDGAVPQRECDYGNNEASYVAPSCP